MAAAGALTFLKVGGSLSERGNPGPLMETAGQLARQHPLVIVPGGAAFAEEVRRATVRFGLSDPTAHRMALLAMDQYGLLLAELSHARVARDLGQAARLARGGQLTVFLPSRATLRSPLPQTWQVTSDTIAAWFAGEAGASQLILLKDVDGALTPDARLRHRVPAKELQGVVDEAFAAFLPPGLRCWIINGFAAERLEQLLQTGSTLGTEVVA